MNIEDVVGTKVMVLFHSAKGLGKLGIDGMLIPPEQRVAKRYLAQILIPWGNVRAIAAFPEREKAEPELESEEVRSLGTYL